MAIYHANIKSFSRGKGQSSVAAAAYRAGICLRETRTDIKHNYSKKKGVVSYHMLAPFGAPAWCWDAKTFWDINESFESRANARTAREVEVALPQSLNGKQRQSLALDLGQLLVNRYKVAVLAAIHAPPKKGDERNHHVHLLLSAREVHHYGLGDRACSEFDARQGRGAEEIRRLRKDISGVINDHLKKANVAVRVDHRSLAAQARSAALNNDFERARELSRAPTKHLGKSKVALMRKTKVTTTIQGTGREVASFLTKLVSNRASRNMIHGVPKGHSHQLALDDFQRERQAQTSCGSNNFNASAKQSYSEIPSAPSFYTGLTRQVSGVARIARSQGKDAEILNKEAELIEKWIKAQQDVAEQSLDLLRSIPGIQIEQCFQDAYGALLCKTAKSYTAKPLLFEDTEILARAMKRYACMIVRPHRARVAYLAAQAQLSEHTGSPNTPQAARAQQHYQRKKTLVSKRVLKIQGRRTGLARQSMMRAYQDLEAHFRLRSKVTTTPVEDTSDQPVGLGGHHDLRPRFSPKP
ncbi:MobA/MobL family protein [Xanthomonas euvesicatoria]|uniref:MobA/MobL family protein n=1 Tax=Xanthomonas euvesicatoria TaxID=456327 RepID=UPI001C449839|nr:MobA/MobL family protein [Xanthomonas campestris pv. veroniae]